MTQGRPGPRGGCSDDPQTHPEPGLGWRPQDWTFWLMQLRDTRPPASRAWLPGRRKDRILGPHSDLLHIVSREEALLAMQPAFPPARGIFHEDLDDLIHVEAQLIHVLAHILI